MAIFFFFLLLFMGFLFCLLKSLQSCFLLNYVSVISSMYIHKQICSKLPILLHFVRPKRPSDNRYISCFLTDKTALNPSSKCYLFQIFFEIFQLAPFDHLTSWSVNFKKRFPLYKEKEARYINQFPDFCFPE